MASWILTGPTSLPDPVSLTWSTLHLAPLTLTQGDFPSAMKTKTQLPFYSFIRHFSVRPSTSGNSSTLYEHNTKARLCLSQCNGRTLQQDATAATCNCHSRCCRISHAEPDILWSSTILDQRRDPNPSHHGGVQLCANCPRLERRDPSCIM